VVQRTVLKERQIELIGDQCVRDMMRKLGISLDKGQRAGAGAFIRGGIVFTDPESEMGVVIEEERRDMIVVNQNQGIRLLFLKPLTHRLIGLENRRPRRIGSLPVIERKADRG
jgi:hypothetical protein